jgi:catechol 2,3-dioxygenase-like lactoylglutathione lyase family enzyme
VNRPTVTALTLADPPELWAALGFTVLDSTIDLGGVRLSLGAPGRGITAWTLRGIDPVDELDGLPTTVREDEGAPPADHANSALGVDHVVVVTPDFERTQHALEAAGLPLRRIRDAGGFRQGFRRLGPVILELVEAREAPPGPARFWGLVVTVEDLRAVAAHTGAVKPAVQPGRHIATVRRECGLSLAVAFMDPEPA